MDCSLAILGKVDQDINHWLVVLTHLEELGSWDDDIPNMWKKIQIYPNVPNHQPGRLYFSAVWQVPMQAYVLRTGTYPSNTS